MDMPAESDRTIYGNMTFEEARAAKARCMSTDEWYRQSRASRAMDVALDRAERVIVHALELEGGGHA